MNTVILDMREMLPTIRKAFDEKSLQMFKAEENEGTPGCFYSGPCAIGVCLDEDVQHYLDGLSESLAEDSTDINTHFNEGRVTTGDDPIDWVRMQIMHDGAIGWISDHQRRDKAIKEFEKYLTVMEQKYLG
jgi:hypothetical protein